MPCASPRRQWFVDGEWTLTEPISPSLYRQSQFSCGSCAPCRLANQGEWTTRLMQEGQMHRPSVCVTLTYAPEHLPPLGSLDRTHSSAFVRALRKLVAKRGGPRLSVDCYGEYSPAPAMRPHYHLALFNYMPPDAKPWAKSQAGNQEFISEELSKAWRHKGRVTFQPWSYGAAQYCAGHQSWKLTGDKGRAQRLVFGPAGELLGERAPEFHQPSTRPGIGRRFFEAYGAQALQLGFTVVGGRQVPVPGYYYRRGDVTHPELAKVARAERTAKALELQAQLLAEGEHRLDAIEECAQARIERASRKGGLR